MERKDEINLFLSNPVNRLLVDLNTVKERYKPIFKQLDKVKNLCFSEVAKIVIDYQLKNYKKVITEKELEYIGKYGTGLTNMLFAIYTWKKWKKIYSFNETLISTLNDQADNSNPYDITIPSEFLEHIPYKGFFISAKDCLTDVVSEDPVIKKYISRINSTVDGFYVLFSYDNETKQKLLTFEIPLNIYTVDNNSDLFNINSYHAYKTCSFNYEIVLTDDTIGKCIDLAINDRTISQNSIFADVYRKITMRCITYLLYILSAKSDIVNGNDDTYKPKKKKESIIDTIPEVQQFNVGYRVGAVLKNYKLGVRSESYGDGKKKVPHTRRGHWHHYWTGPRNSENRELIVHWIPPIAINSNWGN